MSNEKIIIQYNHNNLLNLIGYGCMFFAILLLIIIKQTFDYILIFVIALFLISSIVYLRKYLIQTLYIEYTDDSVIFVRMFDKKEVYNKNEMQSYDYFLSTLKEPKDILNEDVVHDSYNKNIHDENSYFVHMNQMIGRRNYSSTNFKNYVIAVAGSLCLILALGLCFKLY